MVTTAQDINRRFSNATSGAKRAGNLARYQFYDEKWRAWKQDGRPTDAVVPSARDADLHIATTTSTGGRAGTVATTAQRTVEQERTQAMTQQSTSAAVQVTSNVTTVTERTRTDAATGLPTTEKETTTASTVEYRAEETQSNTQMRAVVQRDIRSISSRIDVLVESPSSASLFGLPKRIADGEQFFARAARKFELLKHGGSHVAVLEAMSKKSRGKQQQHLEHRLYAEMRDPIAETYMRRLAFNRDKVSAAIYFQERMRTRLIFDISAGEPSVAGDYTAELLHVAEHTFVRAKTDMSRAKDWHVFAEPFFDDEQHAVDDAVKGYLVVIRVFPSAWPRHRMDVSLRNVDCDFMVKILRYLRPDALGAFVNLAKKNHLRLEMERGVHALQQAQKDAFKMRSEATEERLALVRDTQDYRRGLVKEEMRGLGKAGLPASHPCMKDTTCSRALLAHDAHELCVEDFTARDGSPLLDDRDAPGCVHEAFPVDDTFSMTLQIAMLKKLERWHEYRAAYAECTEREKQLAAQSKRREHLSATEAAALDADVAANTAQHERLLEMYQKYYE